MTFKKVCVNKDGKKRYCFLFANSEYQGEERYNL